MHCVNSFPDWFKISHRLILLSPFSTLSAVNKPRITMHGLQIKKDADYHFPPNWIYPMDSIHNVWNLIIRVLRYLKTILTCWRQLHLEYFSNELLVHTHVDWCSNPPYSSNVFSSISLWIFQEQEVLLDPKNGFGPSKFELNLGANRTNFMIRCM